MNCRNRCRWTWTLACLLTVSVAQADDIRPDSDARPLADEKCYEKCDTESDRCMQDAEGDPVKMEACDEQYDQCLKVCERG